MVINPNTNSAQAPATRTSTRDHSRFNEKMAVDWGLKKGTMEERAAGAAAKRAKKDEVAKIKANEQAEKNEKHKRGVAKLAATRIQMELEDEDEDANFRKRGPARENGESDEEYDEHDEEESEEVDGENAPKKVSVKRRTRVLYVTDLAHTLSLFTMSYPSLLLFALCRI